MTVTTANPKEISSKPRGSEVQETRLNGVAHRDLETLKDMAQSLNIRELRIVAERSDKAWRVAQKVIAAELVQLVMDTPSC
jgi:hypothetical protein